MMRLVPAVAIMAMLAGPVYGQSPSKPVPRYGDIDTVKTPGELETERQAETAYKRSLGNVPDAKPADPWGGIRSDDTSKTAKSAPVRRTKSAAPAN